ncbi:MAG: hypothetical protein JXA73_05485 [Acidobacteria bacterium]|nr:hypothetical protein [Acidobacteriota bacterium]
MATFELRQDSDKFQFDTLTGAVTKNGAAFGKWTTDNQNRLIAQPKEGKDVLFTMVWKFNDENELCLLNGGNQLVNFHDDARPSYSVDKAVLNVKTRTGVAPQFQLHGEWDLDDSLRLTFTTPDNVKSVLEGRLNDLRSRFVYRFASRTPGRASHQSLLLFVGTWRTNPEDQTQLQFLYKRENLTEDIFSLPGTYAFDAGDNKLMYSYAAEGRVHDIAFLGYLRVTPDFQICYAVKATMRQTGGTIAASAVFANPSFNGTLQLAVDSPRLGKTTYSVAGHFTHVRQSGTKIGVGFAIAGGGGQPLTLMFQGTFAANTGGTLDFTFTKNAQNMTISFTASQIKIGGAVAGASATIELAGGKLVGVEAMFGITFGSTSIAGGNA